MIERARDAEQDKITGTATPIIGQLEVDTKELESRLIDAQVKLGKLNGLFDPLEDKVIGIGNAVATLTGSGSDLKKLSATLSVSPWILGFVIAAAVLATIGSVVALASNNTTGKRIFAAVVGIIFVIAIAVVAWQTSASFTTERLLL